MASSSSVMTEPGQITSEQKMKREFAKFIVANRLPFNLGESVHTLPFLNSLNPLFGKISENEVIQEASAELESLKKELRSYFASQNHKIALALDVWWNDYEMYFLRVMAHWIDDDWLMQRRILSVIWLRNDEFENEILERTRECIRLWGIDDLVFSFTYDDNTKDPTVVGGLRNVVRPVLDERVSHSNCVVTSLDTCLDEAWDSVKEQVCMIWRGVSIVRSNFKLFCEKYGYEPNIFHSKGVGTRNVLRTLFPYKYAITEFISDKKYFDGDVPIVIGEKDWEAASLFCRIVDVFLGVTKVWFYEPSSSTVLRQLVNVAKLFSDLKESVVFNEKFSAVKESFLKDFGKIPDLYCAAAVMDPRIKLSGCECLLEAFYRYTGNLTVNVPEYIKGISNLLHEMCNLYVVKSTGGQSSSPEPATDDHAWSLLNCRKTDSTIEELDNYLRTPPIFKRRLENFDTLAWWKKKEKNYPGLASMVRDLLTIPLSTFELDIPVLFLKDIDILDERASELGKRDIEFREGEVEAFNKQLELRTCLKDWLHAAIRVQGKRVLEYDECLSPYPDEEQDIVDLMSTNSLKLEKLNLMYQLFPYISSSYVAFDIVLL